MKNKNNFNKFGIEFLIGIFGFLASTIESKIGIGIFLIITGIGILTSHKIQGIEESLQTIGGLIIIAIAVLLFIWRIDELRNEKKSK